VKTMTLNAKWCIWSIFEQYFETKYKYFVAFFVNDHRKLPENV